MARDGSFLSLFDGQNVPPAAPPEDAWKAFAEAPVGALGNTAKYVGRSGGQNPDAKPLFRKSRRENYHLQRFAAKLLPAERVAACRWVVQSLQEPVEVHRDSETGRSSYSGLQTCGSVWMCPVCSARISETRRQELNHLLAWSRGEGLVPVMLTLTARHAAGDDLREQLSSMKAAKRRMRQRRDWKALKAGELVGTVTATEVTHGLSGWHVHFHEILLLRAETEAHALSAVRRLSGAWMASLAAEGLDGIEERAFQVQGAAAAGNYITKWGVAEEVALAGKKRGRKKSSMTPSELLRDAALHDDEESARLWREYALVFKGARQLIWSDGLKDLAGIREIEDEQAARESVAEFMAMIDPLTWSGNAGFVGAKYRRVRILDAAETGDVSDVWDAVYDQSDTIDETPFWTDEDDVIELHAASQTARAERPSESSDGDFGRDPHRGRDQKSPYEQRDFSNSPSGSLRSLALAPPS